MLYCIKYLVSIEFMAPLNLPFEHHILLIEDDNVSLFAASEILSRLTAMVDMARDVEEAKEQLSTTAYDLVIADISLPDGTGMDIIHYARTNADSQNKMTPFVALTAHQDVQKHQLILSSGFSEIVTKPLSLARAYLFLDRFSPLKEGATESDDLAIIDLDLGMKRIGADNDEKAVIAIGMLVDSLKEDIALLKQLYSAEDIKGTRDMLHKIKGGLDYSGVPRLQKKVNSLHTAIKEKEDLSELDRLFNAVYEQVALLTKTYQDLLILRRGE